MTNFVSTHWGTYETSKNNQNNIILIGLSATPYKGSGIRDEFSTDDNPFSVIPLT